jgi:hypothetical protein
MPELTHQQLRINGGSPKDRDFIHGLTGHLEDLKRRLGVLEDSRDHPSSLQAVRIISAAKRRRAAALKALSITLGAAPRGCTLDVIQRAERITRLWPAYIWRPA